MMNSKTSFNLIHFRLWDYVSTIVGIIFSLLAITFFMTSLVLIRTLKKYYPLFYENVKTKLWIAAGLLSIPLMIRAILNFVRDWTALNEEIIISEINNTWASPGYNLFLYLFADIVPIAAQLLSMIFGLIRRT